MQTCIRGVVYQAPALPEVGTRLEPMFPYGLSYSSLARAVDFPAATQAAHPADAPASTTDKGDQMSNEGGSNTPARAETVLEGQSPAGRAGSAT